MCSQSCWAHEARHMSEQGLFRVCPSDFLSLEFGVQNHWADTFSPTSEGLGLLYPFPTPDASQTLLAGSLSQYTL